MNFLEQRIARDGKVRAGNILKVDMFLNHQVDVSLIVEMAKWWKEKFSDVTVDRILTIEASGIALAVIAAEHFGVPVVFAKKRPSLNISDDVYSAKVHSFTHGDDNNIVVSKEYLREGENVLIIDDFLADGNASLGLVSLAEQAGCTVCGIGIAIEKGFQSGGRILRDAGYRVESIAVIESMDDVNGKIVFMSQDM